MGKLIEIPSLSQQNLASNHLDHLVYSSVLNENLLTFPTLHHAGCWGFSEDEVNGDDDHDGGDDESFYAAAGNGGVGLGPRLAPRPDDDAEDEKVS